MGMTLSKKEAMNMSYGEWADYSCEGYNYEDFDENEYHRNHTLNKDLMWEHVNTLKEKEEMELSSNFNRLSKDDAWDEYEVEQQAKQIIAGMEMRKWLDELEYHHLDLEGEMYYTKCLKKLDI